MRSIWVRIAPSPTRARLRVGPPHRRPPARRLEAPALWRGLPSRAASCVDALAATSGMDSFGGRELDGPLLCTVQCVDRRAFRRRDELADLGESPLFEEAP